MDEESDSQVVISTGSWRIQKAGLIPALAGRTDQARGMPDRSIRIFVDVDGNGTLEASEVEGLIGLDGVV